MGAAKKTRTWIIWKTNLNSASDISTWNALFEKQEFMSILPLINEFFKRSANILYIFLNNFHFNFHVFSRQTFQSFPMYFPQKSLMIRRERLSSILKDNYHEAEFKDFKNFHFLRNVLLMVINMQFSPTESKISFSSVLNDNEKKGKYFASIRQQIQ